MKKKSLVTRMTIGYARVSTANKQELSVDAQETRIHASAVSKGQILDKMIVDRVSAKDLKRSGISDLLKMVESGQVATIIIWKLDRLTRSIRDLSNLLELLDKHDVALVSLSETIDTSSATGRMMVKMTTLFSEWERETIGERTRTALEHKRTKGERMGNVPYGFKAELNTRSTDGRTVVAATLNPNPKEQVVVARLIALRSSGATLRGIAERLNSEGYKTRRGTAWSNQRVDQVLRQVAA